MALDNRLANQNAPLDNTTIYPKLDQAHLYSSLNWWNEMPYKYTFALHVLFHLCRWCHTSIQPPPSSNDEQWSSICVTNYANHKTPPSIHLKSTQVLTLVWSPWNDMTHFIASHSLIGSSITSLALHHCLGPLVPMRFTTMMVHRTRASSLPFTFATSSPSS